MIFQYTWQQVMDGSKTLTSRIVKPGDMAFADDWKFNVTAAITNNKGRIRWEVGKSYAVQPARTAKAIGRIQLLAIRQYDVRDITAEEARREGFNSEYGFWMVWNTMHLPKAYILKPVSVSQIASYRDHIENARYWLHSFALDSKFQAWQLSFKLAD